MSRRAFAASVQSGVQQRRVHPEHRRSALEQNAQRPAAHRQQRVRVQIQAVEKHGRFEFEQGPVQVDHVESGHQVHE